MNVYELTDAIYNYKIQQVQRKAMKKHNTGQKNKSTKFSLIKRLAKYLFILSMVAQSITYFVIYFKSKNKATETIVAKFSLERAEIKDIQNSLRLSLNDLFAIENLCQVALSEKLLLTNDDSEIGKTDNETDWKERKFDVYEFVKIVFDYCQKNKTIDLEYKEWELLAFYRKSEAEYKNKKILLISIRELLSALSILTEPKNEPKSDSKIKLDFLFHLHSSLKEEKITSEKIEEITKENTLEKSEEITKENTLEKIEEKTLNFEEMSNLFDRMIVFRHFYADSLLRKTEMFPFAKFEDSTGKDLSDVVLDLREKGDVKKLTKRFHLRVFDDFLRVFKSVKGKIGYLESNNEDGSESEKIKRRIGADLTLGEFKRLVGELNSYGKGIEIWYMEK